jgi:hypothetical protein
MANSASTTTGVINSSALDALRELERTYGTADLAAALERFQDRGWTSRRLAADPQQAARILALLPEQPDGWAAQFASTVRGAAATARPYPGTLAEAAPAVN